jgi:hypothetical protein
LALAILALSQKSIAVVEKSSAAMEDSGAVKCSSPPRKVFPRSGTDALTGGHDDREKTTNVSELKSIGALYHPVGRCKRKQTKMRSAAAPVNVRHPTPNPNVRKKTDEDLRMSV